MGRLKAVILRYDKHPCLVLALRTTDVPAPPGGAVVFAGLSASAAVD